MSTETKRGPGRPALSESVKRLDVKLPESLLSQVRERAERDGVTVAEWVRAALHERLAR